MPGEILTLLTNAVNPNQYMAIQGAVNVMGYDLFSQSALLAAINARDDTATRQAFMALDLMPMADLFFQQL